MGQIRVIMGQIQVIMGQILVIMGQIRVLVGQIRGNMGQIQVLVSQIRVIMGQIRGKMYQIRGNMGQIRVFDKVLQEKSSIDGVRYQQPYNTIIKFEKIIFWFIDLTNSMIPRQLLFFSQTGRWFVADHFQRMIRFPFPQDRDFLCLFECRL